MTEVFASRLAAVSGRPVPVAAENTETRGLGPNQLQWCREHLGAFATCERMALAAERHRDEVRKAVGL